MSLLAGNLEIFLRGALVDMLQERNDAYAITLKIEDLRHGLRVLQQASKELVPFREAGEGRLGARQVAGCLRGRALRHELVLLVLDNVVWMSRQVNQLGWILHRSDQIVWVQLDLIYSCLSGHFRNLHVIYYTLLHTSIF